MTLLYEYLGIVIYFWLNEHEPIHVHGEYQGKENKAELCIEDGEVVAIRIGTVEGRAPLDAPELKHFETLVNYKATEIIQKWINYFVLHKSIKPERITRELG